MRARSILAAMIVSVLVVSACGDDETVPFASQAATNSSTTIAAGTTVVSETTLVGDSSTTAPTTATTTTNPTTTAPPTTTTTTSPLPTAADALAGFFAAVTALDADIRAAADLFNAGYDGDAATISGVAANAINALDASPVVSQIPPGLSLSLETAVLGVLADLQSRIAALQGAVRLLNGNVSEVPFALDCLENGGLSADRFAGDVDRAVALAALEPPPTAAPDSVPAGVLAVRVETIRSMNFGCDGCGGMAYTEAIPIDWDAGLIMEGVGFEASFDGVGWQILIYAC